MQIVTKVAEMQHVCRALRSNGQVLGFVPTLGALHEGHLSLVRRARAECGVVAASIFVNPLQFGPGEDFAKYPRTFEQDCSMLDAESVDVLFAPETIEMYPEGAVTTVVVPGVGDRLDGASRPGHFTGGPERAYFGQKDAAQLAVLRQMVRDLNFDLELVACAIVRDPDGLALSSRNRYLSAEERGHALALHRALQQIERMIAAGERQAETLVQAGIQVLKASDGVRVDYLAIVDANTLLPVTSAETGTLVAVAAYIGATRLIDNFVVRDAVSLERIIAA
jgi:pantoate--beta-alanine ligase